MELPDSMPVTAPEPPRTSLPPCKNWDKWETGDADFNPAPEPAASEAVDESAGTSSLCPKCQSNLIDPGGLGWCKACGYCKSLEEDKARIPLETKPPLPRKPSPLGVIEFFQMLAKMPSWAWTMICGIVTVVVFNIPPNQSLALDSLPRAGWATLEIIVGVLMILAAQLWALCVLAPNDDKLNFKDAILPGRLWGMTLKKLPAMRGPVWLATWGIACILSAVFIIGGLSHWMNYLPKKAPPAVEKVE